jgi:hypothetical protein
MVSIIRATRGVRSCVLIDLDPPLTHRVRELADAVKLADWLAANRRSGGTLNLIGAHQLVR